MSAITISDLSFSLPDGTRVFDGLSATIGDGRTGLVAPNGAGKTTLLRLITAELVPTGGSVSTEGRVGYLPQDLPLSGEPAVADVLGISAVLSALEALADGDTGDDVFAAIGEDWDVEARATAQLDRLGLGNLALTRRLGTLSGGEIVALGLAARLLARPDVLLLDEPTNNLDRDARDRLYAALDGYPGCLLVASHDRGLLDRMDRIAELDAEEIRLYGGGFADYDAAVRAEQELAARTVRSAEIDVKRQLRDRQRARERAARRAGTAERKRADAGLPRIIAGARKRQAQESAGRSDDVHAARVDAARARLDEAERALRDDDAITVDLPRTRVPAGRTLFTGEGLRSRTLFCGNGIDLSIRGPERIALRGANGAGKSTLLRLISGDLQPDDGVIRRAPERIAYLSQRLDLLDAERTVDESFAAVTPSLPQDQRRTLLARFLFRGDRAHLAVGALSGGELLRATLACVMCAEPAPQLLLLDEPTNNLDLGSVGQLESALAGYRGAFVVVSHDDAFLSAIGITRWLRLEGGVLGEAPVATQL